jgi:hypothetical protein
MIMNTNHLLFASALAVAAAVATAQEGTQVPVEPSTLTRAEVKAELARAREAGELLSSSEADWRVGRAATRQVAAVPAARSRAEVRLDAQLAARTSGFDPRYVGG